MEERNRKSRRRVNGVNGSTGERFQASGRHLSGVISSCIIGSCSHCFHPIALSVYPSVRPLPLFSHLLSSDSRLSSHRLSIAAAADAAADASLSCISESVIVDSVKTTNGFQLRPIECCSKYREIHS